MLDRAADRGVHLGVVVDEVRQPQFLAVSALVGPGPAEPDVLARHPSPAVEVMGVQPAQRPGGRSLVLTAAGQRLAAFALDARVRSQEFLAALDGDPDALSIAAGRGAIQWVIPGAIRALSSHGRRIQVLAAGREAAIEALGAGQADLAVAGFDPPPRRFRSRQIASYPQVLMVDRGHELACRERVALADLAGLDLVVPPAGRPHRRGLERALLDAGVPWQPAAEADGWDLLVHLASLGLGATVVNGCVPPPDGMVAIPVSGLPAVRYWAAWRPQRAEHVQAFLGCLEDSDRG